MLNDMTERIMVAAPGGRRPLSFGGGEPLLNSKATPWAGITFEVHRITSFEGAGESGPLDDESGLLVMLDGQVEIVRRDGKRELSEPAAAGRVDFLDGQHRPNLLRMKGDGEAAAFQLSKEWFRRLLLEDVPRGFGLRAPIPHDPTVLNLTQAMRDEVARGAVTGKLFAEGLSVALLSYVVERVPMSNLSVRGNLTEEHRRRLRKYIIEHLGEDVPLPDLAALVGRGPRHFSTLFRRAFGTTPHRYLVMARVAEGARLLAHGGDIDVAEIALKVGFCSHSHFAEAFRRIYGVTPRCYASGRRTVVSAPDAQLFAGAG
jgi:AraC family transcriptional regulator